MSSSTAAAVALMVISTVMSSRCGLARSSSGTPMRECTSMSAMVMASFMLNPRRHRPFELTLDEERLEFAEVFDD